MNGPVSLFLLRTASKSHAYDVTRQSLTPKLRPPMEQSASIKYSNVGIADQTSLFCLRDNTLLLILLQKKIIILEKLNNSIINIHSDLWKIIINSNKRKKFSSPVLRKLFRTLSFNFIQFLFTSTNLSKYRFLDIDQTLEIFEEHIKRYFIWIVNNHTWFCIGISHSGLWKSWFLHKSTHRS